MKVITFRATDDDISLITRLQMERGLATASDVIRSSIKGTLSSYYAEYSVSSDNELVNVLLRDSRKLRSLGKEIPSDRVTKDEIAEFLGITPLSKEWTLFMHKIKKFYGE